MLVGAGHLYTLRNTMHDIRCTCAHAWRLLQQRRTVTATLLTLTGPTPRISMSSTTGHCTLLVQPASSAPPGVPVYATVSTPL